MKSKNVFIYFVIFISGINVYGQDSLIKIDFVVFPLYAHAKSLTNGLEKVHTENYKLYPELLITYSLNHKYSLTSGLLFSNKSVKNEFKDSTFANNDPTIPVLSNTYYNSIIRDETYIIIPIYLNYKLFMRKTFNICAALGLNYPLYSLIYEEKNFYNSNTLVSYNKHLLIFEKMELSFNLSLEINLIKHFSLLFKPFVGYDIIERNNSFNFGLGIGICYR